MNEKKKTRLKLLARIQDPSDLKKMSHMELMALADEVREELIETVSRNGGHLAPNLGVVELSIAVHYTFNAPTDKLIWDVGHQGYVHKLLTGRRDFFRTLRQDDGCLGFLSRDESEYDAFGAGHAGTAISAALGIAAARDRKGGSEKVVAIVGDGSLNCGISLEGLNNVSDTTKDFILILNDNKMSISENVGAIRKYLNSIISGKGYNHFKALAKTMLRKIPHGEDIRKGISRFEEATKSLFLPGVFFEEMGLRYIGPIDGHNLAELTRTLKRVQEFKKPVIVHVITEKGRGYHHAENAPEKFHGLASFDRETGVLNGTEKKNEITFSKAFGESLCELAEKDEKVVAITAAMAVGTGLTEFADRFPGRFFDVGIAEEHAVVFAAGLAAEGLRPVLAIYSTFLQRALDCVYHDICLQNLPVIIAADRSGIVEDGPTHHGIYDTSFLRCMPNLSVLWPKDENELRNMMWAAYGKHSPVVLKYPRGGTPFSCAELPEPLEWGKAEVLRTGGDLAIFALGRECGTAMKVADILEEQKGVRSTVVNPRFLLPFDCEQLVKSAGKMPLLTLEDCQMRGGLAAVTDEILVHMQHKGVLHLGWQHDRIPPHGTYGGIRRKAGLYPEEIVDRIVGTLMDAS